MPAKLKSLSDMIGSIIATVLTSNTDVAEIISDRVFPVAIPQTIAMPCVVYYIGSNETSMHNTDGSGVDKFTFTVDALAKRYAELDELASKIRAALNRHSAGNVQNIFYRSERDDFDHETLTYIRTMEFQMRIRYDS